MISLSHCRIQILIISIIFITVNTIPHLKEASCKNILMFIFFHIQREDIIKLIKEICGKDSVNVYIQILYFLRYICILFFSKSMPNQAIVI